MHLHRTAKAHQELTGRRNLGVRERAALLLSDGNKTRLQVLSMLKDNGETVDRLLRDGYLQVAPKLAGIALKPDPSSTAARPAVSARTVAPLSPVAADLFEGKRSLATTRMFLFDLVERMFARRAPEQATTFRDRLRDARDRHSMLEVARAIILEIELVAGAERADGISERIAMLLPSEGN